MDRIREKLEEQILADIENLSHMQPGSEEYERAVDTLAKLYGVRIEEDKTVDDKQERVFRIIRIAVDGAGIVLPLIFYGVWMRRGLKFEETGAVTSPIVRNLFSKITPKLWK